MRFRRLVVVFAVCTLSARTRAADTVEADRLFAEGRRLMNAGDLAAACPMLARSVELDRSSGALINLARCHELQGRLATAWSEYVATESVAIEQGKTARADEAKARAAALLPRVPFLLLHVTEPPPGLAITRDGEDVPRSAWESKILIDPGSHTLAASAPGRAEWRATVTVLASETHEVIVPPLEMIELPPMPIHVVPVEVAHSLPSEVEPSHEERRQGRASAAPWLVAGAGVVLVGVGTWSGLSALSDYRAAERACPSHGGCIQSTVDTGHRAGTKAWIADVSLGLAVVAAGTSGWLFLRSADEPRAGLSVGGPSLTYVGVSGVF